MLLPNETLSRIETLAEAANRFALCAEMILCIPCLLFNAYFAFRFGRLSTFSPNLRVIMISTNIAASMLTFVHPFLAFLDESSYSVERGHYFTATLFYLSEYILRVVVVYFGAKIMMITVERRIAFIMRDRYEQRDGMDAVKCLSAVLFMIGLVVAARIYDIYRNHESESIDDRLKDAFIMDRSPWDYMVFYSIAGVSFTVSALDMRHLTRAAESQRYSAHSLSESFQIKQTLKVLRAIWPLFVGYVTMCVACIVLYFGMLYDYYYVYKSVQSPIYRALCNIDYLFASTYVLFSTFYLMWCFKAMRKILADDLLLLFGFKINVKPKIADHDPEKDMGRHFAYLENLWNKKD